MILRSSIRLAKRRQPHVLLAFPRKQIPRLKLCTGCASPAPQSNSFFTQQRPQWLDTVLAASLGLGVLLSAGFGYLKIYKYNERRKMSKAFKGGYDPALELAFSSAHSEHGIERRPEQDMIDSIINGETQGSYFLMLGPKGVGKATMILQAMKANQAEGVAIVDCHEDLEVFRLRLGKALDFEFLEDFSASLFQRREPRSAGPQLDIERALAKLEQVAIKHKKMTNKPLVLVLNNTHLFKNDQDGTALLRQIQARAESWAESRVLTCVMTTDDHHVFERLKKTGSRMELLQVGDLDFNSSFLALKHIRATHLPNAADLTEDTARRIYDLVGGRMAHLSMMARSPDIEAAATILLNSEKEWLMSHIGLIEDFDDDVMDEQKWCSSSWLLLKALAEDLQPVQKDQAYQTVPGVTYGQARQLMTRADFIQTLDILNVISIDSQYQIRMDSRILLNAVKQVVAEEGFSDRLEGVLDRITAVEWLGRTRELTLNGLESKAKLRSQSLLKLLTERDELN